MLQFFRHILNFGGALTKKTGGLGCQFFVFLHTNSLSLLELGNYRLCAFYRFVVRHGARVMGYRLLSFAAEDDADGEEHDFQVEQQGHILHIDDVAIEALDHFLHRIGIAHADGTPAG